MSLNVFLNIRARRLTRANVADFWRDLPLRFNLFGSEIATQRLGPHKFSEIWPMVSGGNIGLSFQGSQMKFLDGVPVDVALWH